MQQSLNKQSIEEVVEQLNSMDDYLFETQDVKKIMGRYGYKKENSANKCYGFCKFVTVRGQTYVKQVPGVNKQIASRVLPAYLLSKVDIFSIEENRIAGEILATYANGSITYTDKSGHIVGVPYEDMFNKFIPVLTKPKSKDKLMSLYSLVYGIDAFGLIDNGFAITKEDAQEKEASARQ